MPRKKTTKRKIKKREDDLNIPLRDLAGDKNGINLVTFLIVIIVLVIIIAFVFSYSKGKISKINNEMQKTDDLSNQVVSLQSEVKNLKEKAKVLEDEAEKQKKLLMTLFAEKREIPEDSDFDTTSWEILDNAKIGYKIMYPASWELAKNIVPDPKQKLPADTVYLQPKEDSSFAQSVKIIDDYKDFAKLTVDEKFDKFKELEAFTSRDIPNGKLIYFLNIDENQKQTPTALVLSRNHIFRLIFDAPNKDEEKYENYQVDFEKMVATFVLQ